MLSLQAKKQSYSFHFHTVQFWLTELLSNHDQQICSYLEEKLRIYAELGDLCGFDDVHVEPHLLIKPDSGETPQAASLLAAALREGEFTWEEWVDGSSCGQIF